MRKLIAALFPQAVLISCLIISFVFVVDIQKIKGAEPLTVEGVWVITSCNGVCDNDGYTIVRQGNDYKVTANGGNSDGIFDIYRGSASEIVFKYAPNYNHWVSINKGHNDLVKLKRTSG